EISIFPFLLGLLLLLPFILFKKECRFRKSMLGFFLVFGLFGAITRLSYMSALILGIPLAMVAFLLFSEPLWTILFGKLYLKERVTKRKMFALALLLAGLFILFNPTYGEHIGNPIGILLALVGGISYSGWVIYSRKGGLRKYHFLTEEFGYIVFSLLFVIILYPIISLVTQNPSMMRISFALPPVTWLYLLIFILISRLIPYSLFFKGIQKTSASSSGIILLLEPISVALLAVLVLDQPLTPNILLGGTLIIIANYFALDGVTQKSIRKNLAHRARFRLSLHMPHLPHLR
ncbi:MAG: EamA family transporter, partial [Nitrospinae bacterium]|nr:EamA family transporter [Nitrospinota bacterium]